MGWQVHLQHDSSVSLLAGSLSFLLLVGRSLQLRAMQAFPQNCLSVLKIQLWVSLRASDLRERTRWTLQYLCGYDLGSSSLFIRSELLLSPVYTPGLQLLKGRMVKNVWTSF